MDVLVLVEMRIERRQVNRHVRMNGVDRPDAFGSRDQADEDDRLDDARSLRMSIAAMADPPVASIGSTT